jgi:hypothetical protein
MENRGVTKPTAHKLELPFTTFSVPFVALIMVLICNTFAPAETVGKLQGMKKVGRGFPLPIQ